MKFVLLVEGDTEKQAAAAFLKRLKQDYKKVTDGRDLFAQLDPAVAASRCPHLKAMLDEMLILAKSAGL